MDLKEGVRGALSAGTRKPPGMGCAGAWQVGRCPRNLRRAREGRAPRAGRTGKQGAVTWSVTPQLQTELPPGLGHFICQQEEGRDLGCLTCSIL